jgi:hypothetical protein
MCPLAEGKEVEEFGDIIPPVSESICAGPIRISGTHLTPESPLSSLKLARMAALSFWTTARSSAIVLAARTFRMNCFTVTVSACLQGRTGEECGWRTGSHCGGLKDPTPEKVRGSMKGASCSGAGRACTGTYVVRGRTVSRASLRRGSLCLADYFADCTCLRSLTTLESAEQPFADARGDWLRVLTAAQVSRAGPVIQIARVRRLPASSPTSFVVVVRLCIL